LSVPGLAGVAGVEVADALGRVVERLVLGPEPLDWRPALPAGSYFLRLDDSAARLVVIR
jgi:hypothetical protein